MKKVLAILLTLVMVLGLFPTFFVAQAAEETATEDWIHMPIDAGMSSGTTYSKVTDMLRADGSTQSMKVETGASASNLTFNTATANDGSPIDMTDGMIGGYFFFGDQTPHVTIRLCDKGWNGGVILNMEFLDAGNGWYYGYKKVSTLYFYASQIENGASREAIIRVTLGFDANTTAYIDGLQFPTQFPESGVVLPETMAQDWTNMYFDAGMSSATYEISTEKAAPDSQQSLKITAAAGDVGYVVLHSEYAKMQGEIEALPDFSSGKITAWFYFGDQRPMAFLRAYDSTWKGSATGVFQLEDKGNGWYYGFVPVSDVAFMMADSNAVPSEIIRIMIGIPGDTTVYVDKMQWEPVTVTEEQEKAHDLLSVSSVVDDYTTINAAGLTYEDSTDMVSGVNSLYSKKITASAGTVAQPTIRYELPQSYDLTKQTLAMDLHLAPNGLSFRAVYLRLQDSNGEDVVRAVVDNIYGLKWNHIEIDLYKFLVAGKDLSDVKYMTFLFYFDRDTDKDRVVCIDNVTITPYETVDSPLNGQSALYIGDSISIAKPFKGWAGLLEERYGVVRTNVSVGGTTFSTIGAQIKNQLNSIPADAKYDYVILEGGCNDFYLHNDNLGAVSDIPTTADPSEFDDTAIIGAFEQLLCMVKQRFPTAKIGYIITYQRGDNWINNYIPQAIAACEKWGIPYFSLPQTPEFINYFCGASGAHSTDTVHANVAGYELIMEHIPQWMESIPEPEYTEPEVPETPKAEDLFSNAQYAHGIIQSDVTNGSETAWKLTPTVGPNHNWIYAEFTLDTSYPITGKKLVMDVMPFNVSHFRMNLSNLNGAGLSGVTSTYYKVGQWSPVTIDLSAYEGTYPEIIKLTFGMEIPPAGDGEYGVYIDNVYLISEETYEEDWINLPFDEGDSTADTYKRVFHTVKDENSSIALELKGINGASGKVSFNTETPFGTNFDMSNGILGAWFYFGEQTPKVSVQFCGNWKASVPAAFTFGENHDGWYYGTLDTKTITFYETAGTMADIERIRLMVVADYTVYVDYLTYTPAPHTHSYDTVVTPPTATKEGFTTYTCSGCGDSYVGDTVPALGIGELKFSSAALVLKDNLNVKFHVSSDLFIEDAYSAPYVVFQVGIKTQTVTEYQIVDGNYVFTCTNLAPSQLGDTITATLYATLGDEVKSVSIEYGVATYCYNMLGKTEDAKLRTLLVDLLNYGAAAQTYSQYKKNDLCNADLTEEQKAWGTSEAPALSSKLNTKAAVVDNAKATWKAAALVLNNGVTMRFRFAAESTEGLTVKIVAAGQEWTVSQFTAAEQAGQYYADFSGLSARQMREVVSVTVMEGDTAVSNTLEYSVETYAYNKQNEARIGDLVLAMMRYGDSAAAYLN